MTNTTSTRRWHVLFIIWLSCKSLQALIFSSMKLWYSCIVCFLSVYVTFCKNIPLFFIHLIDYFSNIIYCFLNEYRVAQCELYCLNSSCSTVFTFLWHYYLFLVRLKNLYAMQMCVGPWSCKCDTEQTRLLAKSGISRSPWWLWDVIELRDY